MDSDISGTINVHTYIKLKEDKFYTNFIVIIEMNLQKMKKTSGSHREKTLFQSSIGLRLSGYVQILNPPNVADLLGCILISSVAAIFNQKTPKM